MKLAYIGFLTDSCKMMANDSDGGRSGPGLFTGLGGHLGGMGGPPGGNLGQLSPYLNVDPSYLQQVIF